MFTQGELALSCWIIEAARSAVMDGRGLTESVARSAERARILARKCKEEGIAINPEFANAHSRWVAEVAGSEEDTGALGWFFLQRLGSYVDAHMSELLDPNERDRLVELGAADADAVNEAVGSQGLPPSPPPEFPKSPEVHAPGKVRARIGVIGDPHIGLEVSEPMITAAINDINQEEVDATIIVGDLTQNGKAELFTQARSVFEKLQCPWIVTLGNHDMWGGHDTDHPVGLERFKSAFEREPFAIHEAENFRLIAINSADPSPSPFPPFDLTIGGFTDQPNESVPGGTISDEMADWMSGIEPGPPTLVMLHHPPFPYMGFPPMVFGLDETSTKTLESFIERIGAWGVICGHTHRSILHQLAGIPYLEVISSKEWPFGYGIIELSDEGWSYNLKPISDADLVAKASARSGVLFRRYAQGEEEARSFVWKAREPVGS